MISIERLLTIKPEVSKLFVFLRQENELITSKFVEHDILNFVNQQIQENDKDFFAFNHLGHSTLVALVKKNLQWDLLRECYLQVILLIITKLIQSK